MTVLFETECNIARNVGGLAIKSGSSALAKIVNNITYTIENKLYTKSAADLTALTGYNVTTLTTAVLTVYVDTAGTVTYGKSVEVLNTALTTYLFDMSLVHVSDNSSKAIIGFIIIKNASVSVFTGGTTNLDAASITATYIDTFTALGK